MRINKLGFSLMEVMVILLITAIVAAASTPMVTKKTSEEDNSSCFWRRITNGIVYGNNPANTDTVSIGSQRDESNLHSKLFIRSDNSPQLTLANGNNRLPILFTGTSISIGNQTIGNNSVLAGVGATAGNGSVAIGTGVNADDNAVAVGDEGTSAGVDAIAIGQNAKAVDTGIAIGKNAQATGTNAIAIGKDVTANSEEIVIGRNGVQTTVQIAGVQVTSSDRRLKNVGTVFTGGLEQIRQLVVYNYTFKDDKNKTPRVGVIAQDLQKIFPNAVIKGSDGFLNIRQEDMFYSMVNAIKELDKKINIIERKQKKIDKLEKRVCRLKNTIAKLESKG